MNNIYTNQAKTLYKKIQIEPELFNKIEYLNYVLLTHEHILQTILTKCKYKYDIEIYDHFMNEYTTAGMEIKLIMQEIIKEEDPDFLKKENYYYELNLIDNTLDLFTIEKMEAN